MLKHAIMAYTDLLNMCVTGAPAAVGVVRVLYIDTTRLESGPAVAERAGLGKDTGAATSALTASGAAAATLIKTMLPRLKEQRKSTSARSRTSRGHRLSKRGRGEGGEDGAEDGAEDGEGGGRGGGAVSEPTTVPIETSADKIAENMINIMIQAFKRRENGRYALHVL